MPQNDVKKILEDAEKHFVFSGAQLYAQGSSETIDLALGKTSYWPGGQAVDSEILFDIGSITKVVATASLIARLVDRKEMDLAAPLSTLAPKLSGTRFATLTPLQILTHTGGLLDWYPVYKETDGSNLLEWFKKSESKVFVASAESKSSSKVLYSDLGFLLLWEALKEKLGPIDTLFHKEVVAPLKLTGVGYGPVSGRAVASTEYDSEKKGVLSGVVFDENARRLDGKAPHAGLFSSAKALAPWCKEWLGALAGKSNWLSQETASLFTRCHTPHGDLPRGLGFDFKSETGSSAGTFMSRKTFGHLGFTGCSVWMDPDNSLFVIFLTNRVHPSRVDERVRGLRPVLHDAVIAALGGA